MEAKEKAIKEMAKEVAKVLGKSPEEWERAVSPMQNEIPQDVTSSLAKLVSHPKPKTEATKQLIGFKTHTFLDNLYLDTNGKTIDGIPIVSQIGITGLPSSGKSILIEEIAIRVAHNGKKVLLITSEDSWNSDSRRMDLQARLMQKTDLLKLNWAKISENLFVLDTITKADLRGWNVFAQTYRYIIEKEKIDLVLVDSVTLLETYRGALKVRLLELSRYNQIHGITAIYVNQRASEDWDVRHMAGGIGIGHVLDSTIIIDYGRTYHEKVREDLGEKRGVDVRIVRVLGSRLSGFDGTYQRIHITQNGFLRLS